MLRFSVGERVTHKYLGNGEVTKIIKSSLDNSNAAYIVLFDSRPDVRYNMGENPTMVFPSGLQREAATAT